MRPVLALFCLKIFFTITNSVDTDDEMLRNVAFHLDLHRKSIYLFRGLPFSKGKGSRHFSFRLEDFFMFSLPYKHVTNYKAFGFVASDKKKISFSKL